MRTEEVEEEAVEVALYYECLSILAEIAGRTYEPGELIFNEHEPGLEIFFILTGEVCVFLGSGPSRRELTTLVAGDIFGEMALINHLPRSASAQATAQTRLVLLDRRLFYHLVGEYPILAKKVIDLMGRRMSTMDSQFKHAIAKKEES